MKPEWGSGGNPQIVEDSGGIGGTALPPVRDQQHSCKGGLGETPRSLKMVGAWGAQPFNLLKTGGAATEGDVGDRVPPWCLK